MNKGFRTFLDLLDDPVEKEHIIKERMTMSDSSLAYKYSVSTTTIVNYLGAPPKKSLKKAKKYKYIDVDKAIGMREEGYTDVQIATELGCANSTINKRLGNKGDGYKSSKEKIPRYLRGQNISPYISEDLREQLYNPIWFKTADGGGERKGFKATLLPDICDVWLKARDAGILVRNQSQTAKMADILIRGLSRIGILALVDEATGYQKRKDEYQTTLALYIAEEMKPWVKTFKDEYYEQLYKLLDWDWKKFISGTKNHPQVLGKITNQKV